jgi:uncharacterized protein
MHVVINIEDIEAFVDRDYTDKDIMHNLTHVYRIQKLAVEIAKNYEHNSELLVIAAYFHGNIYFRELEIRQFLRDKNLPQQDIERIIQIAWESQKGSCPETIEGKILHDAHLLEGGKTFMITKSLVTGTARGQSLLETITYLEENIIGKFKCYLPELQQLYEKTEEYTKAFIEDLKSNL